MGQFLYDAEWFCPQFTHFLVGLLQLCGRHEYSAHLTQRDFLLALFSEVTKLLAVCASGLGFWYVFCDL